MKGIVVIPVYNDVSKLSSILSRINLDVVLVDDGSKVPIKPFLKGLRYKKLIEYRNNMGMGYAMRRGFSYAIKNGYDYVIKMDSDGELLPEDIPVFQKYIGKYDLVMGQRKVYRSLVRSFLNFAGSLSFKILFPKIKDTQCGFIAIRAELLKKMKLKTNRFEIATEILLEVYMHRAHIKVVLIRGKPTKKSNVKLKDYIKINDFFDSWVLKNRRKIRANFIKRSFLLALVYFGIITSFIMRRLIKWKR